MRYVFRLIPDTSLRANLRISVGWVKTLPLMGYERRRAWFAELTQIAAFEPGIRFCRVPFLLVGSTCLLTNLLAQTIIAPILATLTDEAGDGENQTNIKACFQPTIL